MGNGNEFFHFRYFAYLGKPSMEGWDVGGPPLSWYAEFCCIDHNHGEGFEILGRLIWMEVEKELRWMQLKVL